MQCLASNGPTETLQVRVSLIVYAMSLVATVGWILLLIFGAIGMVTLPMDWIREFISRPRATISRKQYVERAKDLARRARDIQYVAEGMKRQERESGRSRKWRKNYSALQAQVTVLEDDEAQLQRVYPQGEDPAYSWTITVIMYWVKLLLGVCAVAITITWVLQIILYILIDTPVTPLLNTAFIQYVPFELTWMSIVQDTKIYILCLQSKRRVPTFWYHFVWNFCILLATGSHEGQFQVWFECIFLQGASNQKRSNSDEFFIVQHVSRVNCNNCNYTVCCYCVCFIRKQYCNSTDLWEHGTLRWSRLCNSNTYLWIVFLVQLRNIDGIKYIYTENIYIYCFVVVMILTLLVLFLRGPDRWKRKKPEDFYRM